MRCRVPIFGFVLCIVTACNNYYDRDFYDGLKIETDEAIALTVLSDYCYNAVKALDYDFNIRFSVTPIDAAKDLVALRTEDFQLRVTYTTATNARVFEETVISIKSKEEKDGLLILLVDGGALLTDFFDGRIEAKAALSVAYEQRNLISNDFTLKSPAIAAANEAFMIAMNRKASLIGMTNSIFNNPYGGNIGGFNESTVSDLLKMALFANEIPKIRDVWSTNSATCQIYGPNARTVTIASSSQKLMDSYYKDMHPGQNNPYSLLGSKGGGWSNGDNKAFSFIGITEISGQQVVAVSATVNGDAVTGRIARIKGIIELFDIASSYIAGQDISDYSVKNVEMAIVAILPDLPQGGIMQTPNIIYSLNPETTFNPASTSKVLAMITMVDYLSDYEECHEILAAELLNDSSTYIAQVGDVESINTSLYAMMLASNAANALSLARICGEKILELSY